MNTIEMLLGIVHGYETILGVEGPPDLPLENRLNALLMTFTHCALLVENSSDTFKASQLWEEAIAAERAKLNQ